MLGAWLIRRTKLVWTVLPGLVLLTLQVGVSGAVSSPSPLCSPIASFAFDTTQPNVQLGSFTVPSDGNVWVTISNPDMSLDGVFYVGLVTAGELATINILPASKMPFDGNPNYFAHVPIESLEKTVGVIRVSPDMGTRTIWVRYRQAGGSPTAGTDKVDMCFTPDPIDLTRATLVATIVSNPWDVNQVEGTFTNHVPGTLYLVSEAGAILGGGHVVYVDGSFGFSNRFASEKTTIGRRVETLGTHSVRIRHEDDIFRDNSGTRTSRLYFVPDGPIPITLDIKPDSALNVINCKSNNVVPVAILSDAGFDATTVDISTTRFGRSGTEASQIHARGHPEDVDSDGDIDMLLHFRSGDTAIRCDDTEAKLTGQTRDGAAIEGRDSIRTTP